MRRQTRLFLRRLRGLAADQSGAALVEFTAIAPMWLTLWFGIVEAGLLFNNYVTLSAATAAGALTMSIDRGIDATPYTDAKTAITSAASVGLNTANITIAVTIAPVGCSTTSSGCTIGTAVACSTDAGCKASLVAGSAVTVKTTYPCFIPIFWSGCSLSATASNVVQ